MYNHTKLDVLGFTMFDIFQEKKRRPSTEAKHDKLTLDVTIRGMFIE